MKPILSLFWVYFYYLATKKTIMLLKLKSLFGICTFLLLNSHLVVAQTPNESQQKIIKSTVASQFGEVSKTITFQNKPNNFCTIGMDTFYNPDGFYYIFQLKGDSAIRLDNSSYHGANFGRYFFSWQNQMYHLGGYGFFSTNNNLISFNRNTREWNKINTTGNGPEFIFGFNFINNDKLFSFNNFKGGNNVCKDIIDSNFYVLELSTMVWQRYKLPNVDLLAITEIVKTADYCLYNNENKTILINKKEIKYEIIENEKLNIIPHNTYFNEKANIISFEQPNSTNLKIKTVYLNLDSVWNVYRNSAAELYDANLHTKPLENNGLSLLWIIISAVVILVFVAFIYLWKTKVPAKKSKPVVLNHIQTTQLQIMYLSITKLNKPVLNVDELDKALDIMHLEAESRKLRRFRHVIELNELHPGFINRLKHEEDKRKFLYQINLPQAHKA